MEEDNHISPFETKIRNKYIISPTNTLLVVIDMQEKLINAINDTKWLINNVSRLIRGFKIYEAPILYTEQKPDKLGKTINEISKELEGIEFIEKDEFSCFQNENFNKILTNYDNIKNIVVCGIEAHICVLQTCIDGMDEVCHYNMHFVADAITSRKSYDYDFALDKMKMLGVLPTTVEIALFELLKRSNNKEFREISKIVKEFNEQKKLGFH